MPRRPSMQFYPADWRANDKLKAAGMKLQGVWLNVMCMFHDSDEYGLLRWPLDRIATAVPCHPNDLKSLVQQRILNGAANGQMTDEVTFFDTVGNRHTVLSPQPGPCWYSTRMLIDEFRRQRDRANGAKGGNPRLSSSPPLNSPPPERVNPLVNPSLKMKEKMKILGNGEGLEGENPVAKPETPRQREMRLALENR